MAIKTSGKSVVVHDSSVWSFHMRRLCVVLDRSSQADGINFFFNRFGKFHSRPSFPTFSEVRSDQNPEFANCFGHQFPSKVLSGRVVRSMRRSPQLGHLGFNHTLTITDHTAGLLATSAYVHAPECRAFASK
eukprot:547768-Amphidinium_carterae.1